MKKALLILIIFSIAPMIQAQEEEPTFWDNVRFGGGVGLSFGNGFFSGTLAPSAIYDVNEVVSLGVGLNGTYNSFRNNYNSTILGGGVISLFNVIPELQLSAEFEQLNVQRKYEDFLGFEDENYWYPALFIGGGYRTGNFTAGVRYDVLYDEERSIYASAWAPFFRVYF